MNGGRKKWLAEGRDLTPRRRRCSKATYQATAPDMSIRAFLPEVQDGPRGRRRALVDVRSPQEFTGEILRRPGCPRPASAAATSPARRASRGARRATRTAPSSRRTSCSSSMAARASTPDKPVIAYCRIGERSSHTWFVLKHLLGYEDVKNYDGSWTEWGNLVGAPVEKGAAAKVGA